MIHNKTLRAAFLALAAGVLLASCGGSDSTISGTATVDNVTTQSYCPINPQVISMLGTSKTELSVEIKDDAYTFSKTLTTTSEGSQVDLSSGSAEVCKIAYTFYGSVASSDGNTYQLSPATSCDYDIDVTAITAALGDLASALVTLPTYQGSAEGSTDEAHLRYFYSPYIVSASDEDATKSLSVTIEGGALTFPGYSLTEEE